MTDSASAAPDAPAAAPGFRPRRRKKRLGTRARILLIAGCAVVLAAAVTGAVLLGVQLDAQAARDEWRAARAAQLDAADRLGEARAASEAAVERLGALIEATTTGLAITGAGLDDAARAPLESAEATASQLLEAQDGSPDAAGGIPDPPGSEPSTPAESRAEATRLRAAAARLDDDAGVEETRARTLGDAVTALESAIAAYATATGASGSALLAERGDADDASKAALQAQLDALGTADAAALGDTLTAYRAAVDAVVASSDTARAPRTPGGTGVRVSDPLSLTVVVNKRRGLAADYTPPDLVTPSGIPGATQVRQAVIAPLERMRADMAAAGITLRMSSAYRSYARQQTIYNGFVANEGVSGADTHSARPGNSEHQTGLAVDLDDGTGCNLNVCFANTAGGRWLAENSWKYGFILRYGDGWQPIVGYSYEPWHFRFVGEDVAADMHAKGIRTLEEYYGLPAAPDYG